MSEGIASRVSPARSAPEPAPAVTSYASRQSAPGDADARIDGGAKLPVGTAAVAIDDRCWICQSGSNEKEAATDRSPPPFAIQR